MKCPGKEIIFKKEVLIVTIEVPEGLEGFFFFLSDGNIFYNWIIAVITQYRNVLWIIEPYFHNEWILWYIN